MNHQPNRKTTCTAVLLLITAVMLAGCTANPGPATATLPLPPTAIFTATATEIPATATPVPTMTSTATQQPDWRKYIHVGPAAKVEDMIPLPYEKFDEIFPVIRQMEVEYMSGKDISQNETYMSGVELLPGHPFSTFDVVMFDTVGERNNLEIASMNMFVDGSGRKYFFVGLPHHNRQRGGGFIDFYGHYLVDLDAMARYVVSIGKPELLTERFDLQVVLDAITNDRDRVLEARVFVNSGPRNEILIEGQGWQYMQPIILLNDLKADFTNKIIELRQISDTPGAAFDEEFIKQYEELVIPVAWFSFVE